MNEAFSDFGRTISRAIAGIFFVAACLAFLVYSFPIPVFGWALLSLALATALNILGWRLSRERTISAFMRRERTFSAFVALASGVSAYGQYDTAQLWPWAILALIAFGAMLWFNRRYVTVTRQTEARPDPESWLGATSIVHEYGSSFGVGMGLMTLAVLWPLPLFFGYLLLLARPTLISVIASIGIWIAYVAMAVPRVMTGYRASLRSRFPDKPYVWATSLGMNVRDKAFIPWNEIKQIDAKWESPPRGGKPYVAGAIIETDRAVDGGRVIVPLQNATTECAQAVEKMRAMAVHHGRTLPPFIQLGKFVHKAMAGRLAQAREAQRAMLQRLPEMIAENERLLADLPNQKLRIEAQIANHEKIMADIDLSIGRIRASRSSQEEELIADSLERKATLEGSYHTLQTLLANLPQREQSLIEAKQLLEKQRGEAA
jgi:hypothetical protein